MTISVRAYNYVSELEKILEGIKKDFAEDFSQVRFVVPSRRDKFWWTDRNFQKNDLWTWDEIYKDVCDFGRINRKRVLSPPDHLLILNSILKKVLGEYPEKVKALPGMARPGFLGIISEDIRELMNELAKPEMLDFNPESENASEFLLPQVYARYTEYLQQYDLLDSAEIYTAALEEIKKNQKWGRGFTVIFCGFLSFNHAQLELVRAMGDRCRDVIILKPETNLENFHDAHAQIYNVRKPIEKSQGRIRKISVAEPALEPEVIARKIAIEPEFKNFDGIGIMIDKGREAAFAEAFERYGIPYDFMAGVKINLTLPGKILSSIRHLNSRNFPSYETAMLLTQPCFAGNKFPVMKAYRAGCSGLEGWEEYLTSMTSDGGEDSEIFKTALLAIKSIKKFRDVLAKNSSPEKIMSAFDDFLTSENLWLDRFNSEKIAELPELDETIRTIANVIETVQIKVLALNELLPDIGAVQNEKLKNDEAYDFLERWCANTDTRAPVQISNAVRIFTGTPPVLSSFPIWIMTGVTQKTWSSRVKSSPLLNDDERKKLEAKKVYLPKNSDKAAQHEALFRRLIQIGEKFTMISCPELDEEGRPLSESPFFEKFRDEMPWKIISEKSEGIKILLGSDGYIFPEIDAGEKIFRKIPVIKKSARSVGASDIHKLLSCPFLWWQEKGANFYQRDTDIVSPNEWGIMLHKFWERIWRRYRTDTAQNFLSIVKDEWNVLTKSENKIEDYENFSRLIKDFRLRRKLDGIKFRVERLGKLQNEILERLYHAGYRHEKILLEDEACLRTEKDGVTFLGQCDRIEIMKAPNGEKIAFIADYKEGNGEKYEEAFNNIADFEWNIEKRPKFFFGLQLSVYAALFEKNSEIRLTGVYIPGFEDGKISGSILNAEDIPEIFNIFSEYKSIKFNSSITARADEGEYAMTCAAEILKAGIFAPEYQSDMCKFCKIKSLCRKSEFKGEVFNDEE